MGDGISSLLWRMGWSLCCVRGGNEPMLGVRPEAGVGRSDLYWFLYSGSWQLDLCFCVFCLGLKPVSGSLGGQMRRRVQLVSAQQRTCSSIVKILCYFGYPLVPLLAVPSDELVEGDRRRGLSCGMLNWRIELSRSERSGSGCSKRSERLE